MIPHVKDSQREEDFQDIDLQYGKDNTKHVQWYHKVLLNRPLKVVVTLILVALLTPTLLYQFIFLTGLDITSPDGYSLGSCLVSRSSRLPCGVSNVTAENCHQQCCYDHNSHMCFHRFPSRFSYILDRQWTDELSLKPRVATVPFNMQNSFSSIHLAMDEVSSTHLTMIFYNSEEIIRGRRLEDKQYEYEIQTSELNIVINSTQGSIFNTMRGPLIASQNIWEIAFRLTNESMYGFGEIPIKAGTEKVIYNHRGGMSAIPLIYAKINSSYHGLLIDTVNPTEVTFREENIIGIRSITNYGLKFHLFVGPRPEDVMRDVMKHIGANKSIEYWMLGAHVCSESSNNMNSTDVKAFIEEASELNMPFESHCVKPIVFDSQCDPESVTHINEGAGLLKNASKKFVPHVSPFIIFDSIETNTTEANDTNTVMSSERKCPYNVEDLSHYMLQDASSNTSGIYVGLVGSKRVVYPDYDIVTAEHLEQLWIYTTDLDGVVLENIWPLDESEKLVNETNRYLPYFNGNFQSAFNHTPLWNSTRVHGENYFYNHNKYSSSFSKAFENITSPHIGTSSQWMNGNVFISRESIAASWTDLQKELIEAALGGISGHWQWSTPVCGNTDNFDTVTHASLCLKWYLAATYMPMIKIHSKYTLRDPLSFIGTTRVLMIEALQNRLILAPYFYKTLQEGPLLRPMFYQFPESDGLRDLVSQFAVGNDLMIVPNLQPSQSMVHVVIPPGVWYEFWGGLKFNAEEGDTVTMATTEADFLTLIRGGSIVVMQKDVKLTAEETRYQSNFTLTVALKCETHTNYTQDMEPKNITECFATGSLYMGANSSIHFETDGEELRITSEGDLDILCSSNPSWAHLVSDINIYGLENEMNNYDHMRHVNTVIDLCVLQTQDVFVFDLVS